MSRSSRRFFGCCASRKSACGRTGGPPARSWAPGQIRLAAGSRWRSRRLAARPPPPPFLKRALRRDAGRDDPARIDAMADQQRAHDVGPHTAEVVRPGRRRRRQGLLVAGRQPRGCGCHPTRHPAPARRAWHSPAPPPPARAARRAGGRPRRSPAPRAAPAPGRPANQRSRGVSNRPCRSGRTSNRASRRASSRARRSAASASSGARLGDQGMGCGQARERPCALSFLRAHSSHRGAALGQVGEVLDLAARLGRHRAPRAPARAPVPPHRARALRGRAPRACFWRLPARPAPARWSWRPAPRPVRRRARRPGRRARAGGATDLPSRWLAAAS